MDSSSLWLLLFWLLANEDEDQVILICCLKYSFNFFKVSKTIFNLQKHNILIYNLILCIKIQYVYSSKILVCNLLHNVSSRVRLLLWLFLVYTSETLRNTLGTLLLLFNINITYITLGTLHYRHFKCHSHFKWPVVHQQLHVIRNTAHRPSMQADSTCQ